MPDSVDTLMRAIQLLREGKNQEADDLLTANLAAVTAAAAKASGVTPPPAPPRPVNVVYRELASEIVAHLGSPHHLVTVLAELDRSLAAFEEASK